MPNHWAIYVNRTLAGINAKPMGRISACMFQQVHKYSLAVIKVESLYQLLYLRFICQYIQFLCRYLFHMIKIIMLCITAQLT